MTIEGSHMGFICEALVLYLSAKVVGSEAANTLIYFTYKNKVKSSNQRLARATQASCHGA